MKKKKSVVRISCQELCNKIVLQPSPSDRYVKPLLLIDLRENFFDFDGYHIYFSVHINLNNFNTDVNIQELNVKCVLEGIKNNCLSHHTHVAKFNWRRICDIVFMYSNKKEKRKFQFLSGLFLKENPHCNVFRVKKFKLDEFEKRFWYLMTNSYIQTYHYYPSLIFEEERIYLGDFRSSSKQMLQLMKIRYIVNCASNEIPNSDPEKCKYMSLTLEDDLEEKLFDYDEEKKMFKFDHIEAACNFISGRKENKYGVLIHCRAGRSRSASLCIGVMMVWKKWRLNDCLEFLKIHRPIARPNKGFLKQLVFYDKFLFEK